MFQLHQYVADKYSEYFEFYQDDTFWAEVRPITLQVAVGQNQRIMRTNRADRDAEVEHYKNTMDLTRCSKLFVALATHVTSVSILSPCK